MKLKLKPKKFVLGAAQIGRKIVKFRRALNDYTRPVKPGKPFHMVAGDESGYLVTFPNLPDHKFYVHPAEWKKDKPTVFTLTEARTGLRVSFAKIENAESPLVAIELGRKRIENFIREKGIAAFTNLVNKQPSVTSIRQGYDGTKPIEGRGKGPAFIPAGKSPGASYSWCIRV